MRKSLRAHIDARTASLARRKRIPQFPCLTLRLVVAYVIAGQERVFFSQQWILVLHHEVLIDTFLFHSSERRDHPWNRYGSSSLGDRASSDAT